MFSNFTGYSIRGKTKGKLKHWAVLFEEWCIAHERYCRVTKDEAAFWYRERANVGVLAAAAWRCGWVALEEFGTQKTDRSAPTQADVEELNWKYGRADLFIGSENHEEWIEAKFNWASLNSTDLVGQINKSFKKAVDDANCLKGDQEGRYIAISFISFYIKPKTIEEIDNKINEAINQFNNVDFDACAWVFPEILKETELDSYGNKRVGVAMFVKVVD